MGVRWVHVPEVGREPGQLAADVRVGVVPVDQRADRKSVPEIVRARSGALTGALEPNLDEQIPERVVERALGQPLAVAGDEQRACGAIGPQPVAGQLVVAQRHDGCRVQRDLALLAPLPGRSDHACIEVDHAVVEREHFANPHARHGE